MRPILVLGFYTIFKRSLCDFGTLELESLCFHRPVKTLNIPFVLWFKERQPLLGEHAPQRQTTWILFSANDKVILRGRPRVLQRAFTN